MKRTTSFLVLLGLVCMGCQQQETASGPVSNQRSQPATRKIVAQPAVDVPPTGKLVATNANTATLKAKFVYGGTPPKPVKIDGSKDSFCANLNILSEAMVIGAKGEIQNLALYMDVRRSDAEIPEEMLKAPAKTITLDNKGCVFVPHVMFVRPGQKINVLNSDQTGHNANFGFINNTPINYMIPAGGAKDIELQGDEPAPIPVECNVHSWMKAFVIVQEHPYVGITDAKGELTIENLPVGKVVFKVWHENSDRSITEADVNGKPQQWSRGRMEVDLKAGMNDLGTVTIAPDQFRK